MTIIFDDEQEAKEKMNALYASIQVRYGDKPSEKKQALEKNRTASEKIADVKRLRDEVFAMNPAEKIEELQEDLGALWDEVFAMSAELEELEGKLNLVLTRKK